MLKIFGSCKYGINCKSRSCFYNHPENKTILKCRNGEDCWIINCKFDHPLGYIKPCRYGKSCYKPECIFRHLL